MKHQSLSDLVTQITDKYPISPISRDADLVAEILNQWSRILEAATGMLTGPDGRNDITERRAHTLLCEYMATCHAIILKQTDPGIYASQSDLLDDFETVMRKLSSGDMAMLVSTFDVGPIEIIILFLGLYPEAQFQSADHAPLVNSPDEFNFVAALSARVCWFMSKHGDFILEDKKPTGSAAIAAILISKLAPANTPAFDVFSSVYKELHDAINLPDVVMYPSCIDEKLITDVLVDGKNHFKISDVIAVNLRPK